jgi:RNA polymerase sigma factor (sigma-70 family)
LNSLIVFVEPSFFGSRQCTSVLRIRLPRRRAGRDGRLVERELHEKPATLQCVQPCEGFSFRITTGSANSGEIGLPTEAVGAHHRVPAQISTIFAAAVRLQEWIDEPSSITAMTEPDRQISEIIAEERSRLRNFIRKRVPNEADAEDLLQEVFFEVIEAYRMMEPVRKWSAWMFRVARNRIIDLFRKKRLEALGNDRVAVSGEGETLLLEDVLPSPDAGPAEAYARTVLLDEIEEALDELPEEQREVFTEHEIAGYSFKEIAARTGVSVNTLLSRKHYAVVHLRRRLRTIYDEFVKTERGQK